MLELFDAIPSAASDVATDAHGERWVGLVARRGYEVSSLGRVRTYREEGTRHFTLEIPRVIEPWADPKGYLYVSVGPKAIGVHRLILEGFVGPASEDMVCRHLDGDRKNNRPENLAWGTRLDNAADAIRLGELRPLQGEQHPTAKLKEAEVLEILRLASTGRSRHELGPMFGVHPVTIASIVRGYTWRHIDRSAFVAP